MFVKSEVRADASTVAAAGSTNSVGVNTWEFQEPRKESISRREVPNLPDWLNKINSKKCMLDVAARRSLVTSVRVSSV